ncbi:hypothetical protein ALC57_09375, partial [Trachymyrmex cornetzi]
KRNLNGRWSQINERYMIIRVRKSRSGPNSLLEEVPTLNHSEESTGVTARASAPDSRPVPRLALRIDLHSLHGVLANPLDVPSARNRKWTTRERICISYSREVRNIRRG